MPQVLGVRQAKGSAEPLPFPRCEFQRPGSLHPFRGVLPDRRPCVRTAETAVGVRHGLQPCHGKDRKRVFFFIRTGSPAPKILFLVMNPCLKFTDCPIISDRKLNPGMDNLFPGRLPAMLLPSAQIDYGN